MFGKQKQMVSFAALLVIFLQMFLSVNASTDHQNTGQVRYSAFEGLVLFFNDRTTWPKFFIN